MCTTHKHHPHAANDALSAFCRAPHLHQDHVDAEQLDLGDEMLKEDKPDPTGVGAALRAHWQRTVAEAVETQVQQVRICRGYAGPLRGWLCCSCFQRVTFVQQGSLQGWLCHSCLERDTQDHYKSGCVALAIRGG